MSRIILPLMMFGTHKGKTYIPGRSKGLYPSSNNIYINVRRGKEITAQRALSAMAQTKLEEWNLLARSWANRNRWRAIDGKVVLNLYFYFPDDSVTRDTHNAKKLLFDALEGPIVVNDCYILDRTIDYFVDARNPRIEVEVLDYVG